MTVQELCKEDIGPIRSFGQLMPKSALDRVADGLRGKRAFPPDVNRPAVQVDTIRKAADYVLKLGLRIASDRPAPVG